MQRGFEESLQEAIKNGISKESAQKLAEIQGNINTLAYYDEMISNILTDETSYMFAGAKTVEETAARINQRVQLYLTEQWG